MSLHCLPFPSNLFHMLKYSLSIICLSYSHLASQGFQSDFWTPCQCESSALQEFLSPLKYIKIENKRKIRACIPLVNYSVFHGDWKGKSIGEKATQKMVAFHGTFFWCLETITSRTAWTGGRIRTRSYSRTYLPQTCLLPSQIHLYSWPPQYPVAMSYLMTWHVPQFCSPFSLGEINIL